MGLINKRHCDEDMRKLAWLLLSLTGNVDAKRWQQVNTGLDALFIWILCAVKAVGFC